MSVWTTKSLDRPRTYVLIKHKLSDMNGAIHGIKFRAGWAVVEKDSKLHHTLKRLPMIQGEEQPLSFLSKLKFITRAKDVLTIFGQDVYNAYITEMKPIKAALEQEQHEQINKRCTFVDALGKRCYNPSQDGSATGLCTLHQALKDNPPTKREAITKEMAREKKIELRNKMESKLAKPGEKKRGRPFKTKERPKVEPKVYKKPEPTPPE